MSTYSFNSSILIVDDEEDLRELVREELEDFGLQIVEAANGLEGFQAFQKHNPCLVISDVKMPERNGVELTSDIRGLNKNVPIFIITACEDRATAIEATNQGATKFLEKPINFDQLKSEVKEVLDRCESSFLQDQEEMNEIKDLFVEESKDLLIGIDDQIMRLENKPLDPVIVDSLFRSIHSVKGGAGAISGAETLQVLAHAFEDSLALVRKAQFHPGPNEVDLYLKSGDLCRKLVDILEEGREPDQELRELVTSLKDALDKTSELKGETSKSSGASAGASSGPSVEQSPSAEADEGIMVTNEKLDSFMTVSGDLIVLKNYFNLLMGDSDVGAMSEKVQQGFQEFGYSLQKISDGLQDEIMSVRKVRLSKTFSKLPRIVRQCSSDLGKKIKYKTVGLELGVDKTIAKALGSSMTHLVRNCMDHGIESVEDRVSAGKSEEGRVLLQAFESNGSIHISLEDDGGGIKKEKVMEKAIEKGLVTKQQLEEMSDSEVYDLIFMPGFSTAEKVTNISGRGVGMDAVKTAIVNLNGRLSLESEAGVGTKLSIEIPIPTSVMVEESIIVKASEMHFAIPLVSVDQIIPVEQLTFTNFGQGLGTQFLGKTVPVSLYSELRSKTFCTDKTAFKKHSVAFIRHKHRVFGLLIEQIQDQLEAVIRPFDNYIKKLPGLKGTAILGDNLFAYVIDNEGLLDWVNSMFEGREESQDEMAA